jgi:hypothetical protein
MLGLKVKRPWIERMRRAKIPFRTRKTIEVRRYLPKKFAPKGEELELGDRFYLLCDGEIWGSATLDGFHAYRTLQSFELDREEHQVTPETTPASGSTSYAHLTAAFPPPGALQTTSGRESVTPPSPGVVFGALMESVEKQSFSARAEGPRSPAPVVLYGWCLGDLRFFVERPLAGEPYGDAGIPIPDFKAHGQVLYRGSLPALEEPD